MKNLSLWANNNPIKSRAIITLGHLLIIPNALLLGFLTYAYDFEISRWVIVIFANVFFIAYFLYPNKQQGKGLFKYSYVKQKSLDFLLVTSYSLVIAAGLNHFSFSSDHRIELEEPKALLMVEKINPEVEINKSRTWKSDLKKSVKQMRKKIKRELKELKKELKKKEGDEGKGLMKFLLILLTFGVAIGLGILIAGLACNISCSGQEGLAWVVLILGWTAIIWLSVIAIKNIDRKVGKKRN